MAEIKGIEKDQFNLIVVEKGFAPELLVKDYYITVLLYLLKEVKGIYFKGGTALQKTLLDYTRLSEDIDFTLDRDLEEVKKEIMNRIKETRIFSAVSKEKEVTGFTRMVVHYETDLGKSSVFIDLNQRANLLTKPEKMKIKHFYPNLPTFEMHCLSTNEMIAEKMAATISRNKPRDHFDLHMLLKKGYGVNQELVKEKCKQAGDEFSIIRMFNQAKKLKKRWDEDTAGLLAEPVSFQEIMGTLAKHFRLKEEKENESVMKR